MTNKVLKRALTLMAKDLITLKFKGVQMTMYEGKWEGMIEDAVEVFIRKATAELKAKGGK